MTIGVDPQTDTFNVEVGNSDVFTFHHPTARSWRLVKTLMSSAKELNDEDLFDGIVEHLRKHLCGWKVDGVPYDPDRIEDVVTITGLMELVMLMLDESGVNESEKKRSEWQFRAEQRKKQMQAENDQSESSASVDKKDAGDAMVTDSGLSANQL